MELAEAGADYVGFDGNSAETAELIFWWAEMMTVPCVAFGVGDTETARLLAACWNVESLQDFPGLVLMTGLRS